MEGKFVTFVYLAITVGVVLPVFGYLDSTSQNSTCQSKFVNDPLFYQFDTTIEAVFEALKCVQPDESLLKVLQSDCSIYTLTQKVVDGISAGLEIIQEKNCSAVYEISEIEEETVSAAMKAMEYVYFLIRNLNKQHTEFANSIDEFENATVYEMAQNIRCLFNGMNIVLAEICPENQLSNRNNNALELIEAAMDDAVHQIDAAANGTFGLIEKIYTSNMKLLGADRNDNSCAIHDEHIKAHSAVTQVFSNGFEFLKNFLPKVTENA